MSDLSSGSSADTPARRKPVRSDPRDPLLLYLKDTQRWREERAKATEERSQALHRAQLEKASAEAQLARSKAQEQELRNQLLQAQIDIMRQGRLPSQVLQELTQPRMHRADVRDQQCI